MEGCRELNVNDSEHRSTLLSAIRAFHLKCFPNFHVGNSQSRILAGTSQGLVPPMRPRQVAIGCHSPAPAARHICSRRA